MSCIEAHGLRKAFGPNVALDGIDLRVDKGRILGLVGANGAGKSTALEAILGLTPCQGELRVLGRDPWRERGRLLRDVCFIADEAVLPRWMRVGQVLTYMAGVHPRFDRARAEQLLSTTTIRSESRIRDLSKGMVTQLHLAVVMAVDARLLLLDEPTLGLDILYRKQFYDSLLNDYFDRERTIVVATHQVEEIEHILTDLVFMDRGRIVLECAMEDFESRFHEVSVHPDSVAAARALGPLYERTVFGLGAASGDRLGSAPTARARLCREDCPRNRNHRRVVAATPGGQLHCGFRLECFGRRPHRPAGTGRSRAIPHHAGPLDGPDVGCRLPADGGPLAP